MTKHGWYSAKQSKLAGEIVYTTPDGSEVVLTEVSPTKDYPSEWDDVEYVGPVVSFVRRLSEEKY